MGRSPEETVRRRRQARLYDPATRSFFAEAGIGEGLTVLNVGSGTGDGALLVGALVGPTGRVVGVDANPSILETERAPMPPG